MTKVSLMTHWVHDVMWHGLTHQILRPVAFNDASKLPDISKKFVQKELCSNRGCHVASNLSEINLNWLARHELGNKSL